MCFAWILGQMATLAVYSINILVFYNGDEECYCAVRTGSVYEIDFEGVDRFNLTHQ